MVVCWGLATRAAENSESSSPSISDRCKELEVPALCPQHFSSYLPTLASAGSAVGDVPWFWAAILPGDGEDTQALRSNG